MRKPLVILDRDGVINRDSANYIRSVDDFVPLPGSIEAIARLSRAGFDVAIATNQSGLARGYFDEAALSDIHERLERRVERAGGRIALIRYCPHGPDDGCDCRKPAPGLFRQISEALSTPLDGVPAVGDSARDLEAAAAAGATPLLVRTGNGRKTEAELTGNPPVAVYDDLAAVVDDLLRAT